MKLVKRLVVLLLEAGVIVVMLMAAGLFYVSHHVDTKEFKTEFTDVLTRIVGNPVVLEGELNIALYPSISLEVLGLELEETKHSGANPLARFDRVLVSVRLIPLLSKQVDIDSIIVDGLEINIVRFEDGSLNWDEITKEPQADVSAGFGGEGQLSGVSLNELEVNDAVVVYKDLESDQSGALRGINFRTGAIVPGQSVPFSAYSGFSWDDDFIQSKITLKGIVEIDDQKRLTLRDSSVYATFGGTILPDGEEPGELTAKVAFNWEKKSLELHSLYFHFLGLRADGKLKSADLSKALEASGHITIKPFVPANLLPRYFPDLPINAVDGLKSASFASYIKLDDSGLSFHELAASLDDLTVRGSVDLRGFSNPDLTFSLKGGEVDVDRYIPLFATDEPFYWGDYNLPLWGALRGTGTIRADGLKLMGEDLSDVRLEIDGDKKRLRIHASTSSVEQMKLEGQAELRIDSDPQSAAPTLGMDIDAKVESGKKGFPFLNESSLDIPGKSILTTSLHLPTMVCPEKERSINILKSLSGQVGLQLANGEVTLKDNPPVKFSSANLKAFFSPEEADKQGYYAFDVDMSVKGTGTSPFKDFDGTAEGVLTTAIDHVHVLGSGIRAKAAVFGPIFTDTPHHINLSGKGGFDSKKHSVKIVQGSVKSLGSVVSGSVQLTNLGDDFKAQGNLNLVRCDIKRIVSLLSQVNLETDDPKALTDLTAIARLKADRRGFKLADLEGRFDGVAFSGNVSGDSYSDPLLSFNLSAGAFDLDRYLPPSNEEEIEHNAKPVPVRLPLEVLRWLNLEGKAWFEEFKLADVRTRNLGGTVSARKGKINLTKVKGDLYSGKVFGNWKGMVGARRLSTHLKLNVKGMESGGFMEDQAERDYLRGLTDITIDLTSSGGTDEAVLANLSGIVTGVIRDGSFKFTGYDYKKKKEPTNPKMFAEEEADLSKRRTLFSKAIAHFVVRRGNFVMDRFKLESPLLESTGKGNFNLAKRSIRLSFRNDFVGVPSVRLEIVGDLSNPEIRFPKTQILNDTVKNILSLPEKSIKFLRDLF